MASKSNESTSKWLERPAKGQEDGPVSRIQERRDAFRRDGIRAWEEYRATGAHLTETEADAWLAALEAGSDVGSPECHQRQTGRAG